MKNKVDRLRWVGPQNVFSFDQYIKEALVDLQSLQADPQSTCFDLLKQKNAPSKTQISSVEWKKVPCFKLHSSYEYKVPKDSCAPIIAFDITQIGHDIW